MRAGGAGVADAGGVSTGDTASDWPVDRLVAGDVVVTEIMQNPSAVGDNEGEWFELHNPGAAAVDVTGLQIGDENGYTFQITTPTSIPAGGYLVLGANGDRTLNGGVPVDVVYTDTFLANSADEVVVATSTGVVLDEVRYDGGPLFPDPTGASMSLDAAATDAVRNDDGANWCEGVDVYGLGDLGTPGSANPSCVTAETGDTGTVGGVP